MAVWLDALIDAACKATIHVQNVGKAARHACAEVDAGFTQHCHHAARHVFATIVAYAFYHRSGTRVAHAKTLAHAT